MKNDKIQTLSEAIAKQRLDENEKGPTDTMLHNYMDIIISSLSDESKEILFRVVSEASYAISDKEDKLLKDNLKRIVKSGGLFGVKNLAAFLLDGIVQSGRFDHDINKSVSKNKYQDKYQ